MTKKDRNILDEVLEGARKFFEELENMLNPEKKQAKVPVPVPVRNPRHQHPDDPYNR